jgi:hypothetical protein
MLPIVLFLVDLIKPIFFIVFAVAIVVIAVVLYQYNYDVARSALLVSDVRLAYASTLEFDNTKPQLPFTPSESAIQTLNTDPDFATYADRITIAVSGNKIMLENIGNIVER